MIKYLLPMLVAYTGGKLLHGHRGGVLGAVAVLGVIGGASFELSSGVVGDPPQFLGAMVIGPLSGWVMREIDKYLEDKRPAGFEMLINNFSQGIAGVILAMLGYVVIGPIMSSLATAFGNMVEGISDAGLLPLMDLPIEVGKVLFLNNAINHGVLTPLGTTDVADIVFVIFDAGLTGPPSPGSIFAYITFLPSSGGAVAGVFLGIAAGAAAAFIVGSILLRLFPVPEIDDSDDDTSLDDAMEGVPLN
ncbi:hypothetical protein [Candidatus Poriferisodalis sp.]|uniref:hypothetical protein n=1 Tax=Candidatus Poriferisodalis sp. TaxID=3101277 RepID=UPI003B01B35B